MKLGSTRNPKVAISIPCPDYVHIEFLKSLIGLSGFLQGRIDYVINYAIGSRITVNRNNLVTMARNVKASHILFLDSDMVFPTDTLMCLLAHKKDIVCATYARRDGANNIPLGTLVSGQSIVVKGNELVEFAKIPFGCVLIKMEVFDKLTHPYFAEPPSEVTVEQQPVGEDIFFSNNARKAGYQIWCDARLTQKLGHIGRKIYYVETPAAG